MQNAITYTSSLIAWEFSRFYIFYIGSKLETYSEIAQNTTGFCTQNILDEFYIQQEVTVSLIFQENFSKTKIFRQFFK